MHQVSDSYFAGLRLRVQKRVFKNPKCPTLLQVYSGFVALQMLNSPLASAFVQVILHFLQFSPIHASELCFDRGLET